MPTYQYACNGCGHELEAVQSFSDDPLTTCPECGGSLRKLFGNVGVVFKGSGFYRNDSRKSDAGGSSSGGSSSSASSSSESASGGTSDGGGTKSGAKDKPGAKDSTSAPSTASSASSSSTTAPSKSASTS